MTQNNLPCNRPYVFVFGVIVRLYEITTLQSPSTLCWTTAAPIKAVKARYLHNSLALLHSPT